MQTCDLNLLASRPVACRLSVSFKKRQHARLGTVPRGGGQSIRVLTLQPDSPGPRAPGSRIGPSQDLNRNHRGWSVDARITRPLSASKPPCAPPLHRAPWTGPWVERMGQSVAMSARCDTKFLIAVKAKGGSICSAPNLEIRGALIHQPRCSVPGVRETAPAACPLYLAATTFASGKWPRGHFGVVGEHAEYVSLVV